MTGRFSMEAFYIPSSAVCVTLQASICTIAAKE